MLVVSAYGFPESRGFRTCELGWGLRGGVWNSRYFRGSGLGHVEVVGISEFQGPGMCRDLGREVELEV